jgi:serine acetyltransferase
MDVNIVSRLLKDGSVSSIESAIRFVIEDLPQANNYLTILKIINVRKSLLTYVKSHIFYKLLTQAILTNINHYHSYLMQLTHLSRKNLVQ